MDGCQDGNVASITVQRGRSHKNQRINFDISKERKVAVSIQDYVNRLIQDFPAERSAEAATSATKHFFEIKENLKRLNNDRASLFHLIDAKSVYLC